MGLIKSKPTTTTTIITAHQQPDNNNNPSNKKTIFKRASSSLLAKKNSITTTISSSFRGKTNNNSTTTTTLSVNNPTHTANPNNPIPKEWSSNDLEIIKSQCTLLFPSEEVDEMSNRLFSLPKSEFLQFGKNYDPTNTTNHLETSLINLFTPPYKPNKLQIRAIFSAINASYKQMESTTITADNIPLHTAKKASDAPWKHTRIPIFKVSNPPLHTGTLRAACFAPHTNSNGIQLLFTASEDGRIGVWNSTTAELIRMFYPQSESGEIVTESPSQLKTVVVSNDGEFIASGSLSGHVYVHMANSEMFPRIRDYAQHSDTVWSCAFNSTSDLLVSGSEDHSIAIFRFKEDTTALYRLVGHESPVNSVCFVQSTTLKTTTEEEIPLTTFISGSDDSTMRIWSGHQYQKFIVCESQDPTTSTYVLCVKTLYDGHSAIRAGRDGVLQIHNLLDGKLMKSVKAHDSWARWCDCSESFVATGSYDNTVKIFTLPDLEGVQELHFHSSSIYAVAFKDISGDILATGDGAGVLAIWSSSPTVSRDEAQVVEGS
jgi:WD40 repeat protein